MIERRLALKVPVSGEDVSIPSALHLRCPKCDEVVLRFADSRRLQQDAIAIYRKKHGLLSADEIRAIRDRFGLTQGELARLLHLGANTISRWESGRNVQTEAMEMLLRLLRDLPGSLDYLRQHAAERSRHKS
jgi:putative zinc finger/helix-turn-helix YgiT family protein